MASATELERLVIRLLGDASEYKKVLDEAEKDTKQAAKDIEKAAALAIKAQNEAMAEAARITASVAAPTEVYKQKIKELDALLKKKLITQQTYNRAFEEYEKMLPKVAAAQDKMNRELQEANAVTAQVATAEERYKSKLVSLENLLKKNYITQQTFNRAVHQAKVELDKANPTIDRTAERMQKLGNVSGRVQSNLRSMQAAFRDIGTKMTLGITAPVLGGAAFSLHEFAGFEQGLDDIQASAKPTAAQLELLHSSAMQLSKELKMDPTPILATFEELLKAGMPLEKVLGGAGRSAAQFAKVGKLETATAAVIMADAQKVFGEEAGRTADILSSAADASSTSIRGIAEAFSQTSAVAAVADQSLTDTAAAIAMLANEGIKGSDAGTSLKTMFIALAAPTKHAQDVIDMYGLSIRQANGEIKPMRDLIEELSSKLGGLNDEAQDSALKNLFGTDAFRAGSIFLKNGVAGFEDMVKAMGEANTVSEKYAIIMDNLNGKWAGFWATIKRAAITLGGPLADGAGKVLDYLSGMVEKTVAWMEQNPAILQTVAAIAAVAAALGPILVTVSSLIGVFAGVTGAITLFVTVGWEIIAMAAAITAGLVIFTAEVAVVGAAIGGLIYLLVGPESLANAWNVVSTFVFNFAKKTIGFMYNWRANMKAIIDWLPDHWHEVIADIGNMYMTMVVNMNKNLAVGLRTGFRLFNAFQGWVSGILKSIFTRDFVNFAIQGVLKVTEIFVRFADQAWAHLKGIFTGKRVSMGDFIEQMNKDFEAGADNINFLETASKILKEEAGNLHNPLEGFVSSISEGPDLMFDFGKKTMEALNDGMQEVNPELDKVEAVEEAVAKAEKMSEKAIKELIKARSGKGHDNVKAGLDEGVFFEEKKLEKVAKTIKEVRKEIEKPMQFGGIQGIEAGSVEAFARLLEHRGTRGMRGMEVALPGAEAGLEPKMVRGRVKEFAKEDLKVVAAMEEFKKGPDKTDELIDRMDDMVKEIKIGNDMMRDEDSVSITLEPANLAGL